MKPGLIGSLVVAFLSLLFACVATGINLWYYCSKAGFMTMYFGLWKLCFEEPGMTGSKCITWKNSGAEENWIHACQGMMLLSIVLYVFGVVLILLHATILVHSRQLVKLAGILFCLGGVCNLVAVIVFGVKYTRVANIGVFPTGGKLHAGFGLAIFSAVLGFLAGMLAMTVKSSSYDTI